MHLADSVVLLESDTTDITNTYTRNIMGSERN